MKKARSREWGLTSVSLGWLLLFFFLPTCLIAVLAFKPYDIYGTIQSGWTAKNIIKLLTMPYVLVIIRTLWVSVIVTACSILLAIPVAYYLTQLSIRWRNLVLVAIIVPFWTSFLIRVFAWKTLLHPDGWITQFAIFFGLVRPNGTLLYHIGTVILMTVYTYLPFAILPIYAAASKFDFQLFEAAMDLGATRKKAFFQLFLPFIKGGVLSASGIVFVPTLGSYIIPDVVGGVHSELVGNLIAQYVFVGRNISMASSWSFILIMTILIPTFVVLSIQKRKKVVEAEVRNVE